MSNVTPETQARIDAIEGALSGKGLAKAPKTPQAYDDETLSAIQGYAEARALALADSVSGELESFADYGNGFTVLPSDEKARLVKVPFIVLAWAFHTGDNGAFVSATIVTKTGEKLILNDGSTGIRDQLAKVTDKRTARGLDAVKATSGLDVPGGLRRSDYKYRDDRGEEKNATTYYLA